MNSLGDDSSGTKDFYSEPGAAMNIDSVTVAAQTAPTAARPSSGKAIYTCPMHPEVQQDHPGDCPKCGMALEPKMA